MARTSIVGFWFAGPSKGSRAPNRIRALLTSPELKPNNVVSYRFHRAEWNRSSSSSVGCWMYPDTHLFQHKGYISLPILPMPRPIRPPHSTVVLLKTSFSWNCTSTRLAAARASPFNRPTVQYSALKRPTLRIYENQHSTPPTPASSRSRISETSSPAYFQRSCRKSAPAPAGTLSDGHCKSPPALCSHRAWLESGGSGKPCPPCPLHTTRCHAANATESGVAHYRPLGVLPSRIC